MQALAEGLEPWAVEVPSYRRLPIVFSATYVLVAIPHFVLQTINSHALDTIASDPWVFTCVIFILQTIFLCRMCGVVDVAEHDDNDTEEGNRGDRGGELGRGRGTGGRRPVGTPVPVPLSARAEEPTAELVPGSVGVSPEHRGVEGDGHGRRGSASSVIPVAGMAAEE